MRLYLYVIREHVGPFFLGLGVLTFILLMKQVFRLLDLILGKGLKLSIVLELFTLTLPFILALTVPMAVLVAVLMAFGRLSQDNEITAMKASGIGLHRIMFPVILGALLVCIGMIHFNNTILPESNHRLKNLLLDIRQMRPTMDIQEGLFQENFPGYKIYFKKINYRTSEVRGVWIWETRPGRPPRDIYAESGEITTKPDAVIMTLHNGMTNETDQFDPDVNRKMTFETQIIKLPLEGGFKRHNRNYRGDREMSAAVMRKEVQRHRREYNFYAAKVDSLEKVASSLQGETDKDKLKSINSQISSFKQGMKIKKFQINRYLVEIHKKYSIPVACLIFVLIGAPLGVSARRGTIGAGLGLSTGFFVLYYISLIGGEEMADRNIISPFLAMWGANIGVGAIGLVLTFLATNDRLYFTSEWMERISLRRLLQRRKSSKP